jgi:hypothetical protein
MFRQKKGGIEMSDNSMGTTTWPDLAINLYDKLTGRNAEITYEFNNLEVSVPSSASESAQHATWKLNGIVKIRAKDLK